MGKFAFVSYANEDWEAVRPVIDRLAGRGYSIWRDGDKFLAGQEADIDVGQAFSRSPLILCFLSENSMEWRLARQCLKWAEQKYMEAPQGAVAFIPIFLANASLTIASRELLIPDFIRYRQYLEISNENFYDKLFELIETQIAAVPAAGAAAEQADVKFELRRYCETGSSVWSRGCAGRPGYEADVYFLETQSDLYQHAEQIGEYINGQLQYGVSEARQWREGELDLWEDAQLIGAEVMKRSSFNITDQPNVFAALRNKIAVIGKIASVSYISNKYYRSIHDSDRNIIGFNFFLPNMSLIEDLESLFTDKDIAYSIMQDAARKQMLEMPYYPVYCGGAPETLIAAQWKRFDEPAADGHGERFYFSEKGLILNFFTGTPESICWGYYPSPYGNYNLAEICIPYEMIKDYMKPVYRSALGLE